VFAFKMITLSQDLYWNSNQMKYLGNLWHCMCK